jgi:hypothetical protein
MPLSQVGRDRVRHPSLTWSASRPGAHASPVSPLPLHSSDAFVTGRSSPGVTPELDSIIVIIILVTILNGLILAVIIIIISVIVDWIRVDWVRVDWICVDCICLDWSCLDWSCVDWLCVDWLCITERRVCAAGVTPAGRT